MKGVVYCNGVQAGILEKTISGGYSFIYDNSYLENPSNPPISLTLPKTNEPYKSDILFPFFFGLLSEGVNKEIQCRLLKIDENDDFGRLLRVSGEDTIGAITVKKLEE
ncbi:MAG: HipA N-terminal domain-containing protein [Chitinophagaceae bacterium]